MKHTKGPWFYELDTQSVRTGEQDGALNPNSREIDYSEQDLRLIAAAPELATSLSLLLQVLKGNSLHSVALSRAVDIANAALAKAEGREQGEGK